MAEPKHVVSWWDGHFSTRDRIHPTAKLPTAADARRVAREALNQTTPRGKGAYVRWEHRRPYGTEWKAVFKPRTVSVKHGEGTWLLDSGEQLLPKSKRARRISSRPRPSAKRPTGKALSQLAATRKAIRQRAITARKTAVKICQEERARVRGRVKEFRAQERARINAEVAAMRQAARDNCNARKARIRSSSKSAQQKARAQQDATRALKQRLAGINATAKRKREKVSKTFK